MTIVTQAPAGQTTPAFPFDRFSSQDWPLSKVAFGAEGAATLVEAGAPLPVTLGLTNEQLRATAVPVSFTGQSVGVTGTVTVTAASLPLPTGAATQTTLAALEGKFAALEGGRAPVAVQVTATTTRAYGASQVITTSGTASVRTGAAVTATEITVIATVDGFVAYGDNTVTASAAAGSTPVFAGVPWTQQVSNPHVAFIRAGSDDGSLFILPVA